MNARKNVLKVHILTALVWFMVLQPVIVLFLQNRNLNLADIFLLVALAAVVEAALEIPSGFLSDRYGRKPIIIFACIALFFGYFFYLQAFTFPFFVLAAVCIALGFSLFSGADTAMIFESLMHENKRELFVSEQGKSHAIGKIAETIAAFAGAGLAIFTLDLPVIVNMVIAAAAFFVSLTLQEPIKHHYDQTMLVDTYKTAKKILPLLLFVSLITSIYLLTAWLVQPILILHNVPILFFGILIGLMQLCSALTGYLARQEEDMTGQKMSLFYIFFFTLASLMLVGMIGDFSRIIFLFVVFAMWGASVPIFREHINRYLHSSIRATVFSVVSAMTRLFFVFMSLLIVQYAPSSSLSFLIYLPCLVLFILGSLFYFFMYHKNII